MSTDILLVIFALIMLCLIVYVFGKNARQNKHFDERQLQKRAQGYKIGYIVTIVLLMFYMFFTEIEDIKIISPSFGMFAIVMAGIISFVCYCVFNDAFFSVGDKGTYYIILSALITVLYTAFAVSRIIDGTLLEDGILTFTHGSSLILSVSWLIVFIVLIIKKIRLNHEVNA